MSRNPFIGPESKNRPKIVSGEGLDRLVNPGLSKEDMKRAKQIERERRRRKKAKKKANKLDAA
ncbi:hypothetical protein Ac2012v2_001404 [Leucoagaricus gongylophorus]